ncbi:MAG: hypothetical protein QGG40_12760 [Myxococcota bacterium]|nr:hypothetical protein [Myxococcota bacterium]
MDLTALHTRERMLLSRALRRGDPVRLVHRGRWPRAMAVDQVGPLLDEVECDDPRQQMALESWRAPGGNKGPPQGPGVTVVVPTHRRAPWGIRALRDQDMPVRIKVLVNGAAPRDIEEADVVELPWEGHGATRARGLDDIEDPYVFFTVDDAIPLGRGFLRHLVEALESGPWDAVMARQVAWPDADPVTLARTREWTPPGRAVVATGRADNVATLYRTEVLRQHPFPSVPIAEDAWWSRGRRVAYDPGAPVLHSHRRAAGSLYRRNRDIHEQLVRMGDAPLIPDVASLAASLPGVVHPVLLAGPGELFNQVAELLGQWRGAYKARH